MSRLIFKICDLVVNITLIFEGRVGGDNLELINMKDEVLYRPLPTAYDDRVNLKNDRRKVVGDLNASLDAYKSENSDLIAHT